MFLYNLSYSSVSLLLIDFYLKIIIFLMLYLTITYLLQLPYSFTHFFFLFSSYFTFPFFILLFLFHLLLLLFLFYNSSIPLLIQFLHKFRMATTKVKQVLRKNIYIPPTVTCQTEGFTREEMLMLAHRLLLELTRRL